MRAPLLIAALCATLVGASSAAGAVIESELSRQLALRAPTEEVAVIVSYPKLDYRDFEANALARRDTRLHAALKTRAATMQASLLDWLKENPARRVRELWIINGVALTVPVAAVGTLAQLPGVGVRADALLEAPVTTTGTAGAAEWNLSAVRAPELWSLGVTGSGVVVANMDTGVDANHPDLALNWRGGRNSWYDPHGEHVQPADVNGHGTQTMGLMVGGNVGGTSVGVAPDATWIAAKLYNDAGQALYSDIHLAFQWLLDPDGDATTDDAPRVVNASWGLVGAAGQCISEFNNDIAILKTAGIAVAFAGGNDGPSPLTSISPANNVAGFATGAIDEARVIANFSSRGPSACDGSIYPDLIANVNTTDLSFGGLPLYRVVSGTSFAAPHATGVLALLAGAFPQASVADLETAMLGAAADLGVAGEDNSYGHGLIDAYGAWERLATVQANRPPIAADDLFRMIQGGTLESAAPGILANDVDPDPGDALTARNVGELTPSDGTLVAHVSLPTKPVRGVYTTLPSAAAVTVPPLLGRLTILTLAGSIRFAGSISTSGSSFGYRVRDTYFKPATSKTAYVRVRVQ